MDLPLLRPLFYLLSCMRCYHVHNARGTEKAGNFRFANFSGPNNQAPTPFEFEKKWE